MSRRTTLLENLPPASNYVDDQVYSPFSTDRLVHRVVCVDERIGAKQASSIGFERITIEESSNRPHEHTIHNRTRSRLRIYDTKWRRFRTACIRFSGTTDVTATVWAKQRRAVSSNESCMQHNPVVNALSRAPRAFLRAGHVIASPFASNRGRRR